MTNGRDSCYGLAPPCVSIAVCTRIVFLHSVDICLPLDERLAVFPVVLRTETGYWA